MKKLFILTTLSLTLFSGCYQNRMAEQKEPVQKTATTPSQVTVHPEGFPIVDQPLEMKVLAPGLGLAEWDDMALFKDYEKKTHIQLSFQTPPQSEFKTKFNLALASGDLPDIIYAGGPNTLNDAIEVKYGQEGLFVPLEDKLEQYAPNFYRLMEENPELKKSITTVDGHIYALPHINDSITSNWIMGPMWYNGRWLDKLGVKELPKNVDEFYELMVRFRDEDPNGNGKKDELPISDVNFGGIRHWFMPVFGLKGWGVQEKDGKVSYTFTEEGFRGYLEFMHRLYQDKLIDPEIFSQSNEQKLAKGQDDRIGLFQDWFSYFVTGRSEEEAIEDPMFGPLTSDYQKEPLMPLGTGIKRGSFVITRANPSPEAALRWIDHFYSKEGYEYLYYGPEGAYWEFENGQGSPRQLTDQAKNAENPEEFRATITPAYGITVPGYSTALDPIEKKDTRFDDFIEKETQDKIIQYGELIFPLIYLTSEEQEEINSLKVELETYMIENEAQFINGSKELNDQNWQDYLETMKQIGSERLVDIYQKAYDRWKSVE